MANSNEYNLRSMGGLNKKDNEEKTEEQGEVVDIGPKEPSLESGSD